MSTHRRSVPPIDPFRVPRLFSVGQDLNVIHLHRTPGGGVVRNSAPDRTTTPPLRSSPGSSSGRVLTGWLETPSTQGCRRMELPFSFVRAAYAEPSKPRASCPEGRRASGRRLGHTRRYALGPPTTDQPDDHNDDEASRNQGGQVLLTIDLEPAREVGHFCRCGRDGVGKVNSHPWVRTCDVGDKAVTTHGVD